MCSRKNALCRAADSVPRPPRPPVPRRDRRQKTRNPEMNQPSLIAAPTIRERTNGDLDPRRNRNATYRKPFCLALRRQTAGVIERKTFRENREKSVIRDARSNSPNPARLATGTQNAACGARLSQERQSGHFRQDFKGYGSSRLSHAMNRAQNAAREPHRRAEQPPRPPTLRPELKPAKRNIAPAHDSRPHEAERRSAASARNSPRFQTKAARRPPARTHIPQPTVTPPPRPISVTPDYQKRCCRYETSGVPDADFPADADAP